MRGYLFSPSAPPRHRGLPSVPLPEAKDKSAFFCECDAIVSFGLHFLEHYRTTAVPVPVIRLVTPFRGTFELLRVFLWFEKEKTTMQGRRPTYHHNYRLMEDKWFHSYLELLK
jgi:hypothetical protein